MWFITEVLPGAVLIVVLVGLWIQNVRLRRLADRRLKALIQREAQGTAVGMAQMAQLINVAIERVQAGSKKEENGSNG